MKEKCIFKSSQGLHFISNSQRCPHFVMSQPYLKSEKSHGHKYSQPLLTQSNDSLKSFWVCCHTHQTIPLCSLPSSWMGWEVSVCSHVQISPVTEALPTPPIIQFNYAASSNKSAGGSERLPLSDDGGQCAHCDLQSSRNSSCPYPTLLLRCVVCRILWGKMNWIHFEIGLYKKAKRYECIPDALHIISIK